MNSRRDFIKTTALGIAGLNVVANSFASEIAKPKVKRPIHVFTKCLQFLTYDEIALVLAELGFDGADLTVRKGGQVNPENVEVDLPKAIKALRNEGVDSQMIATDVNNADNPLFRKVLKTMAEQGIRYYRMGYISFDEKKSIPQNLDDIRLTFEKLEKLNREFGVTGNYQNHSGTRVGGPVWDLYYLLKDRNPEYIGVQYDVRHATVEGGESWPVGMKLLSPWIRTTDIKDFIWEKDEKGIWKLVNLPLGEGMVDFNKYFGLYKSFGIEAPVSIHYEYDLGGAEHGGLNPTMSRDEIFSWLKKDLAFLKNKFNEYGL